MTGNSFVRGGDQKCDGCPHRKSYRKYYCLQAVDIYCDTEERCRVEDEADEASESEEDSG